MKTTAAESRGLSKNLHLHFTALIIHVKAKLIKLSEWLSLLGASL